MMVMYRLHGRITDDGKLEVELPKDLPPGEIQVMLVRQQEAADADSPWEERPWTQEELRELMRIEPMTGAEIVEWLAQQEETGWEDIDVSGAEWVEQQRNKRKERVRWSLDS
jgi:hypothetical protein